MKIVKTKKSNDNGIKNQRNRKWTNSKLKSGCFAFVWKHGVLLLHLMPLYYWRAHLKITLTTYIQAHRKCSMYRQNTLLTIGEWELEAPNVCNVENIWRFVIEYKGLLKTIFSSSHYNFPFPIPGTDWLHFIFMRDWFLYLILCVKCML